MVADDHAIVRQGIAALLSAADDVEVVAEAEDGQQAIDLFRQHRPDVALMDLRMPRVDGASAIATLRAEFPRSRFIVLTTYEGDQDVYGALQAGALGYLLKGVKYPELIQAIRDVFAGQRRVPAELAERALGGALTPALTAREAEILGLVAQGRSNLEIAGALDISESTVKNHITKLFAKLGVTTRTQATLAALQRGLVRPG